jgi:hypothetical protein
MIDRDVDRAWLAGLVEGEAYFSPKGHIVLAMTDRDVVERAARLFDVTVGYEPARRPRWSPLWIARTKSDQGRQLAGMLRPAMGERRRAQIDAMRAARPAQVGHVPPTRLARNMEIARRILAGETGPALAHEYGMTHQNIYYIANRYKAACLSG